MNKTYIIGLTGGIATGKSTVLTFLKRLKYPAICADEIAHDVVKKGRPAYQKIIKVFGKDILKRNRDIDRQKLAEIVFHNRSAKTKLEKIIHPEVRRVFQKQIHHYQKAGRKFIVLDVPLLFENGLDKICDVTICVIATQSDQLQRLKKYRGMSATHALARIKNQMPLSKKAKRADYVVRNTATKKFLKNQVVTVLNQIKDSFK